MNNKYALKIMLLISLISTNKACVAAKNTLKDFLARNGKYEAAEQTKPNFDQTQDSGYQDEEDEVESFEEEILEQKPAEVVVEKEIKKTPELTQKTSLSPCEISRNINPKEIKPLKKSSNSNAIKAACCVGAAIILTPVIAIASYFKFIKEKTEIVSEVKSETKEKTVEVEEIVEIERTVEVEKTEEEIEAERLEARINKATEKIGEINNDINRLNQSPYSGESVNIFDLRTHKLISEFLTEYEDLINPTPLYNRLFWSKLDMEKVVAFLNVLDRMVGNKHQKISEAMLFAKGYLQKTSYTVYTKKNYTDALTGSIHSTNLNKAVFIALELKLFSDFISSLNMNLDSYKKEIGFIAKSFLTEDQINSPWFKGEID